MKLIKITFTAWRDTRAAPHVRPYSSSNLDEWNTRISVLSAAIADAKELLATEDSEAQQKALAKMSADLRNIEAERALLLEVESAAADEARRHKRVGIFGCQVLNDAGTEVVKIVDQDGYDLPAKAAYAFEIVDLDPPLPVWATKGKVGR